MTYAEQPECSLTKEELIDQISALLIDFWPLMRKRLVHINALQAESNMPASHIQLLSMLSHEESLSITQISERFEIAKPNITIAGVPARKISDHGTECWNRGVRDRGDAPGSEGL